MTANLKEFRLARKWSQGELADKIGVDRSRVSRIERGEGGTGRAVRMLIDALMAQYPPVEKATCEVQAGTAPPQTPPPSPSALVPHSIPPEDEPLTHCTRTGPV